MGKTVLHELLAVEQGRAETSNRLVKEATKTLGTKRSIFEGMQKSHEVFDEDKQNLKQATEHKEVESTVAEQLEFVGTEVAAYWDVILQKDEANQRAKADIIINGIVLVQNVPSTTLLGMEKKLISLQALYNAIPTTDSATAWEKDENYAKAGVWRSKYALERQHKVTVRDWQIVAPATDRHPAQVQEISKEEILGKYVVTTFSGALSPLDKAEKLERLTALIRAVKEARQRANITEVQNDLVFGEVLVDFING
jgi:hypothetical protein